MLALAPAVTEKLLPGVIASGARVIWMPLGCYTRAAVEACCAAGVREVHDVCPVFATGALRARLNAG